MSRKIPPFASVRAFEAVARLGRHSDAARQLNLTDEGAALLSGVSLALDGLDAAFAQYTGSTGEHVVSVHMYQSLANMWFIPKLPLLRDALPQPRVRIVTEPEEISLSGSDVDLAIVFANSPPQGSRCVKLFDELIEPVCAPEYFNTHAPLGIEGMRHEPLIHSRHHWDEWATWFDHANIDESNCSPVDEMDNRSNALQAAENGVGWAMDRRAFGEELRGAGKLLAPFNLAVPTGNAYYLITFYRSEAATSVIQFRNLLTRLTWKEFPD